MLNSRWTMAPTASGYCGLSNSTLQGRMPPTEDELFRELESLITPLGNRPVTIRLLDVGGDKPLPYLALPPTSNPGWDAAACDCS